MNVFYSWALTNEAQGVTLDNAMSATPKVTIPPLAPGTELTFTVTVKGRGFHIPSTPSSVRANAGARCADGRRGLQHRESEA